MVSDVLGLPFIIRVLFEFALVKVRYYIALNDKKWLKIRNVFIIFLLNKLDILTANNI